MLTLHVLFNYNAYDEALSFIQLKKNSWQVSTGNWVAKFYLVIIFQSPFVFTATEIRKSSTVFIGIDPTMYLTCSLPTRKYLLFHKAKCGASSYNLNFVYTRFLDYDKGHLVGVTGQQRMHMPFCSYFVLFPLDIWIWTLFVIIYSRGRYEIVLATS